MWAFLSSRLRTWLLLAIAVPVVRALIGRAHTAARRRDTDGALTNALGRVDALLIKLDRRGRTRATRSTRDTRINIRRHGAKGGWL